ncbi:MAG TPA: AMP-binding protein, partial [Geminicoccaceae bacterium]|nr:AMP-binding protein [Geminicoccaceae bacterium]
MRGLMMESQLLVSSLLSFAARYHGEAEVVSRTVEGPVHRYTYADAHARAKKLANALRRLGMAPGDRIGTLAWNGHRHFEVYYAVSGSGAVCHTINPRLFPDQIAYIVNHAEDAYVFTDLTFVPLLEKIADRLPGVRGFVVMTDDAHMPQTSLRGAVAYEPLIAGEPEAFEWPTFDENTASSLCYTSGTTGRPKGVLYSHRSTLLHTYAANLPDVFGLSALDVAMPVVPMFHVNAWGIPYCAPMAGAKLVFPGPAMDGPSLCEMIEREGVTHSAGVPTVWLGLLQHLRATGKRLDTMKRLVIGGAALPISMAAAFREHGVPVAHGWGMTEMSPVGAVNAPKPGLERLSEEERLALAAKQGRAFFGIEMKITDDAGRELPRDGATAGRLKVRG